MSHKDVLFQRVYLEMKHKVWHFLIGKLPTREDAEEISQQSWLAFANALKKDPVVEHPKALLRGIIKRKIADFYLKRKQEGTEDDPIEQAYHPDFPGFNLFRWPPGLSTLERQIIIRKFVLGQTFPEMSTELGKSVKALENQYARLIEQLNKRYDKRRPS